MTDDRHYDLSITIVPGMTAPRKLQLIANIDCPRRRNCPPPGVTHNASAPKICRGQPGAKTDSLYPVQPGCLAARRRPCEHKRPIISQHCQFLCIFSRFLFFPQFFSLFSLSFFSTFEGQSARQLARRSTAWKRKLLFRWEITGTFCLSPSVPPIDWRLT